MEKNENLVGKKFGLLTVVKPAEIYGNRVTVWECKCACGNTVFLSNSSLIRGKATSCGCDKNSSIDYMKDLTNQKFGKLTAIRLIEELNDKIAVWECKCDCGNTVEVQSNDLMRGNKKSCGCLKEIKDLTGQKFGKLTAIRPTEERKFGSVVWECKCDCGNTVFVPRASLISGNSKSCGCGKGWKKKHTDSLSV